MKFAVAEIPLDSFSDNEVVGMVGLDVHMPITAGGTRKSAIVNAYIVTRRLSRALPSIGILFGSNALPALGIETAFRSDDGTLSHIGFANQ
jgi:hypothetical protein